MVKEGIILLEIIVPIIIAILVALITLWFYNRNEREKRKKIAISLLYEIRREVSHNLELMKEINEYLENLATLKIPYFSLDMGFWKSFSISQLYYLNNPKLIRKICRVYYDFEHLTRKIDKLFEIWAFSNPQEMRDRILDLRGGIVVHINDRLEKDSKDLLGDIEKYMRRKR